MGKLTESAIEQFAIDLLQEQGYHYLHGPELAPDAPNAARASFADAILEQRLREAVARINPDIPHDAREQAIREVRNLHSTELLAANEHFHGLLTDGVEVEYQHQGRTKGDKVWLVDFDAQGGASVAGGRRPGAADDPEANDCLVVNQFTIIAQSDHGHVNKRPDLILFINGLPLVVIELKNAASEQATLRSAYTQLQNYKQAIPGLFIFNALLVASDGLEARMGSLSAGFSRFMAWKSADGNREASHLVSQLETLIRGVLAPATLLELIRFFTVLDGAAIAAGEKRGPRPHSLFIT